MKRYFALSLVGRILWFSLLLFVLSGVALAEACDMASVYAAEQKFALADDAPAEIRFEEQEPRTALDALPENLGNPLIPYKPLDKLAFISASAASFAPKQLLAELLSLAKFTHVYPPMRLALYYHQLVFYDRYA